jgi:hypothetical protein
MNAAAMTKNSVKIVRGGGQESGETTKPRP